MKADEIRSGNQSHDGHPAGHSHAPVSLDADRRYLLGALGLILAFMVAEVTVAVLGHSVALLADAGHMLTDAGALAASLYTIRLLRRPSDDRMTFGWRRAEVVTAALNGLTLLVVGVLILIDAVRHLLDPVPVDGPAMVTVAAVGVVVNLGATLLLRRADRAAASRRLDISGAVAHLVTDVWAFAGTMVAGLVVAFTGFDRADPIASLVVVAIMIRAAVPLLRDPARILLEGTPEGVDLVEMRDHLLGVPSVLAVHDLHAWLVGTGLPAVSAHVVVADEALSRGGAPQVLDHLQDCLAGHFDVAHSTLQLEPAGHDAHEGACHD